MIPRLPSKGAGSAGNRNGDVSSTRCVTWKSATIPNPQQMGLPFLDHSTGRKAKDFLILSTSRSLVSIFSMLVVLYV